MRPNDGFSNANNEEKYTTSTPVDTREFMSGENRLSDASPDLITLAPGTIMGHRGKTGAKGVWSAVAVARSNFMYDG